MIRTIMAHTNSREANQAHLDSGNFADKKLDFSWMLTNEYIRKVQ